MEEETRLQKDGTGRHKDGPFCLAVLDTHTFAVMCGVFIDALDVSQQVPEMPCALFSSQIACSGLVVCCVSQHRKACSAFAIATNPSWSGWSQYALGKAVTFPDRMINKAISLWYATL